MLRLLQRLADVRQPSPAARRVLLLVGATILLAGSVFAARALELPTGGVRIAPLMLVVVALVPATIAINALELIALGRLLDQRLPVPVAVRVVVLGTAANLLPIPGAAALRIQALAGGGATYRAATAINVAAAVVWLGNALLVAGIAIATLGRPVTAVIAISTGGAATVVGLLSSRRLATAAHRRGPLAALALAEVGTVVVHALRLVVLLGALGAGVSFAAGTVVGTSGPLAAAAGVFPAGLGIAEALAAAAGSLVAVPAAAAFAAAALNRLLGYGVLGLATLVPALRRSPRRVAPDGPDTSTGAGR